MDRGRGGKVYKTRGERVYIQAEVQERWANAECKRGEIK